MYMAICFFPNPLLYPPLIERRNGMVSQAEHTIMVDDEIEILTK